MKESLNRHFIDGQEQKNLTREKTLIEQLPAFPTITRRSNGENSISGSVFLVCCR
jgi:hypothetical protein